MFGIVICVSVSVVVISRCKIDFIFYDWVGLGHNFRLGPEVAGRGLWGLTEWVWGLKKKKTRLLNGPSSSNDRGLAGLVRASKNLL